MQPKKNCFTCKHANLTEESPPCNVCVQCEKWVPVDPGGWVAWVGGDCPVEPTARVDVLFREGVYTKTSANCLAWSHSNEGDDIVAYRTLADGEVVEPVTAAPPQLTGGKLAGNHYYLVDVSEPMSGEIQPYVAECADIIEALNMTFNEGEAFKAIWRLAASRQRRGKAGNQPVYDADKIAHYGSRIAAQMKKGT